MQVQEDLSWKNWDMTSTSNSPIFLVMVAVTLWGVGYWVGWVQLGVSFWSEGMCGGVN